MTGAVPEPQPPSWWKYVGGRDADGMWAKAYVALRREGREISAQDLSFYLAAIERLAAGAYPPVANRPPDRVNYWLACHYWLGVKLGRKKAAAALHSANIAKKAGIARGHNPEQIQRHANELKEAVDEFLPLLLNLPPPRPVQITEQQRCEGLMKWIEHEKVRKVG